MFFKLEYIIRELRIAGHKVFTFDYKGPHDLLVILRQPTPEEQSNGHRVEHAFCTASSRVEPANKAAEIFTGISTGDLPKGIDTSRTVLEYSGPDSRRIKLPSISKFPEHFR